MKLFSLCMKLGLIFSFAIALSCTRKVEEETETGEETQVTAQERIQQGD